MSPFSTQYLCDFLPTAGECNPNDGAAKLLFPVLRASGKPVDLRLPPHHLAHPRGLHQFTSAESQRGEKCQICKLNDVVRQRENEGTVKRWSLVYFVKKEVNATLGKRWWLNSFEATNPKYERHSLPCPKFT